MFPLTYSFIVISIFFFRTLHFSNPIVYVGSWSIISMFANNQLFV